MVPRRPLVVIAGGIGLLLVLVGSTVMVDWLRHWPWAVKLGSDRLLIVFATSVNLTLLGVGLAALLIGTIQPNVHWVDPAPRGLDGVVVVLFTLRLAEMIMGWPIGLDFPGMHTWLDRQWVTGWIGGMHPSHALAMAASATVLSLVPTLRKPHRTRWFWGLVGLAMLLCVGDLLDRAIALEYLYPAWLVWRASDVTAICTLLVVMGVLCVAVVRQPGVLRLCLSPENTIVWISGGCVVLAGLGVTIAALIIQVDSVSLTFGTARARALSGHAEEFDQLLAMRAEDPRLVAAVAYIQEVLRHPTDNAARLRSESALQAYRQQGYSYLQLRTLVDEGIISLGTRTLEPELSIRLHTGLAPERVTL